MTVLVTGATGFVGRRIVSALVDAGERVRVAVRTAEPTFKTRVETVAVGDIGPDTEWTEALGGVELVVHAAGHVHRTDEPASIAAARHDAVNHLGTRRLAECAARSGVRRLVFVSTVKVLGESSSERPFADDTPANPGDAYARSKWHGEEALSVVAGGADMDAVVLRPPLVYGPGVKANFEALLDLCAKPLPLPFGAVANRRSLIFVDNLVAAVLATMRAPAAGGRRLLVCDGPPVSTRALIEAIRGEMGRPARLFSLPQSILRVVGGLVGRSGQVERLIGNAEVNDEGFRRLLGWSAPVSFDDAIAGTVGWYLARRRRG